MLRKWTVAIFIAIMGAQQFGCASDTPQGVNKPNERPTVWLSGTPPEGSISNYRIHLYWGGWDPDGEISHYEYVITNNETGIFDPADTTGTDKWLGVVGNDSVFQFTADVFKDSANADWNNDVLKPYEFRRSHTFFIRAVDEHNLRSQPAYVSFTSRTLSPTVVIEIPASTGFTAARIPPKTTFRWRAVDYISSAGEIQEPDSVRWILAPVPPGGSYPDVIDYIRRTPDAPEWYPWSYYKAPNDSGKFWTSSTQAKGDYVFALQAKDEAGAVTPVFDEKWNVRRVKVVEETGGPELTVTNRYIGSIVTQGTGTPITILDLPTGVPMTFEWSATAERYGGLVSGYRYGWDILDLSDDTQWETSFTPFVGTHGTSPSRTFFFGTHQFYVEVIDNNGFKSRVGVTVNVLPFSMSKDLLLIDDWLENSQGFELTNGGVPSDDEHDAFWLNVLDSLLNFNPATDIIEFNVGGLNQVPLQQFAEYKAVIWNAVGSHGSTSGSGLSPLIRWIDPDDRNPGGKQQPNIVALFMAAGGKVLLVGEQIMTMAINRGSMPTPAFPVMFRYELQGDQDGEYAPKSDVGERGIGDDCFAYAECCLNVLDIIRIPSVQARRRPGTTPTIDCPVTPSSVNRRYDIRDDGLRECLPLDTLTAGGFPSLTLRPICSDPGRAFDPNVKGLNADLYNPPYFPERTTCDRFTEYDERDCFEPIYGNGCRSSNSVVYNAPVAFWTKVFQSRVPDAGGVAGRSAVWGFQPVYFNTNEVKRAIEIILFDEWKLPSK